MIGCGGTVTDVYRSWRKSSTNAVNGVISITVTCTWPTVQLNQFNNGEMWLIIMLVRHSSNVARQLEVTGDDRQVVYNI